ncbi:MAG: hypothetical protein AABN95_12740 [Acidobacteriota bacterium]
MATSFLTDSGINATRASPGNDSRSTTMFIALSVPVNLVLLVEKKIEKLVGQEL